MRRFWAFIIMLSSIILGVVFAGQSAADNVSFSTEYGGGREVVYQLTQRDNGRTIRADDVGEAVMDRLDVAGVKNAHVEVTGSGSSAQLRVQFTPQSIEDFSNVRNQIEATGELSICTEEDYCLTGNEFFADNRTSLLYLGASAYPAFNIRSINAANRFSSALGDDEAAVAYIWQNRDETTGEDNYENAFGENPKEEVTKKVIARITWEGNYMEEDLRLYTMTDKNGTAFTLNSARAYMNAYNFDDYGFDIEELYATRISPTFGDNALFITLVSLGVALIIIALALCFVYGALGATSIVSLLATLTTTILIFSLVGFEFSPASIIGLIVVTILGVFTTVNYLEKVKGEMRKGRSLAKANSEGYRKSFFVTLDSCAILFTVSLLGFLFGQGMIKTFSGVVFIGSIFIFLINTFLNRWMLYWLTTSPLTKVGRGTLGMRVSEKSVLSDKELVSVSNSKKKRITGGIIGASAVVLSTVVLLVTGLTNNIFNNSDNYSNSTRFNIQTVSDEDQYQDSERFLAFLADNNIEISYDALDYERVEKKDEYGEEYFVTYISFKTESLISDNNFISDVEALLQIDDEEASVVSANSTVVNINHDTSSLFLIYGLSILFASLYLFARYGIATFLSYLLSATVVALTAVGIFSALRLPYNSFAGFGLLALIYTLSFVMIAAFGRNKDNLKDLKATKTKDYDLRTRVFNESLINSLPAMISVVSITLISSVALIAGTAGSSILSLFTIFSIAIIVGVAFFLFFMGPTYLFFREKIKFKKVNLRSKIKSRRKKPVVIEKNEPHETIIPGLNDFR